MVLTHEVYNDDTTGLTVLSSDFDDTPALVSYNTATHSCNFTGLAQSTTRTLSVSYNIDSLTAWTGFDTMLNYTPMIWYICLIGFVPLALVFIWRSHD